MKLKLSALALFFLFVSYASHGQIINLIHTKDYETGRLGELGNVQKFGSGKESMILLPGWGFDWTIFESFIDRFKDKYSIYAVTFPGFGNTIAPPMPAENEVFSNLYWSGGILTGLKNLITSEKLERPILVSAFTYSSFIAMRLALDSPELVGSVVIIGGMAKYTANYPSYEPASLRQRINYIEKVLAPRWFKTVDKATWDNGNFRAEIFTQDSTKAMKYWEQMSSVPIPVMVRYLCEFYCTDISIEYENLSVPTLIVVPDFTEETLTNPSNNYLTSFFHSSWLGAKPASDKIQMITVTDTNAFIMEDQPEKLQKIINEFLAGSLKPYDLIR